jgi:DNA-directed RNA polymerase specialized sigma24 family protein
MAKIPKKMTQAMKLVSSFIRCSIFNVRYLILGVAQQRIEGQQYQVRPIGRRALHKPCVGRLSADSDGTTIERYSSLLHLSHDDCRMRFEKLRRMSNANPQSRETSPQGAPAAGAGSHEARGSARDPFPQSARELLLTFVFDLAAQHVRRYRLLDSENLSHEIGLTAFEQMSRQPAARERVSSSLKEGTDEWKRVAHVCVIHARSQYLKRELLDRRRRSGIPVETIATPALADCEWKERQVALWRSVALLDDDRQAVIRLRFERGLTFQEIADELNWNRTRVYGCYATAIIQLERSLKGRV